MSTEELVIPPPSPERQPLRVNLLNAMQKSGMMLMPLFPYLHPGALVPAGSVMIGGPDADHGHFFHGNSVDEVIIAFVARGATLRTGQVYVGGRSHGVNSFLKDEQAEGTFALFSVTQRQAEHGDQRESMTVVCEGCRAKLYVYEFDARATEGGHELTHPFASHRGSLDAMVAYNEDEARRTCAACGHVNRPFPIDTWGWERYVAQAELMVEANAKLRAAAEGSAR